MLLLLCSGLLAWSRFLEEVLECLLQRVKAAGTIYFLWLSLAKKKSVCALSFHLSFSWFHLLDFFLFRSKNEEGKFSLLWFVSTTGFVANEPSFIWTLNIFFRVFRTRNGGFSFLLCISFTYPLVATFPPVFVFPCGRVSILQTTPGKREAE